MDEKPMVRLLVVETDVEANFFKGALEDNGIKALVKGIDGSAFGAAIGGDDEIEVYVYSDMVEEAKAIIVELLDEDEKGALLFLQTRIADNIPKQGSAPCDSTRKNPFLFKTNQ